MGIVEFEINFMNHLLKGEKVFIDTTEFSDKGFDLKNPAFAEFLKLCKNGQLRLLTTEITKREIEQGIKIIAEKSCDAIKQAGDAARILKIPEAAFIKELSEKLKPADFAKKNQIEMEEFFRECKAVTLFPRADAIGKVFELYFDRKAPFGSGKKKAEFPDAFVLQALDAVPTPNHEVVYVISRDEDIKSACSPKNPSLQHVQSLDHLLNLVNRHEFFVKKIRATVETHREGIMQKLKDILESLPCELRGHPGSVHLNTLHLDDVAEDLIVSCDGNKASVAFPCFVDIDAVLELFTSPDEPFAYRGVAKRDVITITLEFNFDPKNTCAFEVKSYWAPSALVFDA
jgi:hypothetical protein